jgi:hypothetical protein
MAPIEILIGDSEYVYVTYAASCIRYFDRHMRCELLRRLNSGVAIRYARNVGLMYSPRASTAS